MVPRVVVIGVLCLALIYGFSKGWALLAGPRLSVITNIVASGTPGQLLVEGVATNTETLLLNGAVLLIDTNGAYATVLTLPSGGVILTLIATDRFGRSIRVQKTVVIP